MMLLFSGEGKGDVGLCAHGGGECDGSALQAGPMLLLADQLAEFVWRYSPLDADAVMLISESQLARLGRSKPSRYRIPGKGNGRRISTGYYFWNAYTLASRAMELEVQQGCDFAAILFRDCDGTHSAHSTQVAEKQESMVAGFAAAQFSRGVPMMPNPKSEVWLMCAFQEQPYQNCARFESISGNDYSKNPVKDQLEAMLASRRLGNEDVLDEIREKRIDASHIAMPSFDAFRARFESVLRTMLGRNFKQ